MAPLTLYTFARSAPCRAVVLVCRNLNLDIELKEVNLFEKAQLSADYLKVNPQHTVPCLDDNGFILWESRAITEYLVESKAKGSPLYPIDDLKKKALVNQRLYFDAGTLYPRIRAICFPVLFLGEKKIAEDKRKQLAEAFEFLNTFIGEHKWVCGDDLTIADLSILASISSIVQVGADISGYKNLAKWYENCKSLPGFAENEAGAKLFGDAVKSKLDDKL
uniref:glutathione transferase n=1 Tax=Corethrella appendiculata TaxID=1370023 RepID=U5EYR3_9DIPT